MSVSRARERQGGGGRARRRAASPQRLLAGAGARANAAELLCTHLAEETRMVLVHHDAVVVLATGVTAAARVLAVLADAAVARGDVAALLAVLAEACWLGEREVVVGCVCLDSIGVGV